MKDNLSIRQTRILQFIQDFLDENTYPPTIRDIQTGCDISSTSVVDYNLRILQRDGYIHRESDVSRGIELLGEHAVKETQNLITIPVLGNIAAGEPMAIPTSDSWETDTLENVDLPPFLTQGKERVFALRVKGESMIDALVADGDLVLMESIEHPQSGDMVAAWLGARPSLLKNITSSAVRVVHTSGIPKLKIPRIVIPLNGSSAHHSAPIHF